LVGVVVYVVGGAQVDGNLITWQKWRIRVGFNSREGLVLHEVGCAQSTFYFLPCLFGSWCLHVLEVVEMVDDVSMRGYVRQSVRVLM
jgi:hypothetical protein